MSDAPPEPLKHDAPFTQMASKIEMNRDNGFAGAYVIVDPEGNAVTSLSLQQTPNVALFWSTLKSEIEIILQQIGERERQTQSGWGAPRR